MEVVGLGRQAQGSSLGQAPDVAAAGGLDKIVAHITLSLVQNRRPPNVVAHTISFVVLSEDAFKDATTESYLQNLCMNISAVSILSWPDIQQN